jgi:hypothetical protein
VAFAAFCSHLIVVAPYGFFRDELYFIACGRRPAFGYVDQPPLVPLIAAATQAFGHSLFLMRLVPALAHAGLVLVTAALAELLEEGAGPIAALAVLIAPLFAGLYSLLNTTMFEPLAWTVIAWLAARALLRGELRCWLWAGVVAGIAMQAKYSLPFFAAPLALGLLFERNRKALFTWQAAAGLAIAAAIALPSVIWQVRHGLPFLELMRAQKEKNDVAPPGAFLAGQVLAMNPLIVPLCVLGLIYGFRRARFLSIAWLGVLLEMLLLHGKDYYVAPVYGVAFALAGAAAVKWIPWKAARRVWLAGATAFALVAAPLSLPLLPPPRLVSYMAALGQKPDPQEKSQHGVMIPTHLSDMIGWPEMARRFADAWHALPANDREQATILVGNYGEAGAIDFFGPAHGLPRARSGHNQYGLWGEGLPDPKVVLGVGSIERARQRCGEVEVVGSIGMPYTMPYENKPMFVCRHLRQPLHELWPKLRFIE